MTAHGLDNFQAGIRQAFGNKAVDPATVQLLQNAGMSNNTAHMANDIGILLATMGGYAAERAAMRTVAPSSQIAEGYAESPMGSSGWQFNNASFQLTRNSSTIINGRPYAGHALDQMQNRGFTPSIIQNVIKNGSLKLGKRPNTLAHYDAINDITVITNSQNGRVITTSFGKINQ